MHQRKAVSPGRTALFSSRADSHMPRIRAEHAMAGNRLQKLRLLARQLLRE